MNEDILKTINKNFICAIIPARSGSKGIKNKNIRLLDGFPMIAYTIAAAKLAKNIDRIIVSTDSREYADIAVKYGAEAPVLRPCEIAGDYSTDLEFMQHIVNWLYENERSVPEYFVHLRPTNPLRDVNIIENAVTAMKNDCTASSLRSAHRTNYCPYKWFSRDSNGYFRTLSDDMTLDDANKPRQEFPAVFIPDGYVDVLRTEYIVNNDKIHGDLMIGFEVPDCIDIDFNEDIEMIDHIIYEDSSDAYRYLKKNFG